MEQLPSERLQIALQGVAMMERAIEETVKYVRERKAFGKPLHSLAVVRSKLAGMIQRTEAVQNWLENITYQMCNMVSCVVCLPLSPGDGFADGRLRA